MPRPDPMPEPTDAVDDSTGAAAGEVTGREVTGREVVVQGGAQEGIVPVLEGVDAGLVWHAGHPLREQVDLEAGRAAVRLDNRGVLTVTGPDRLTWLHSLTSQHLEALAPGVATSALVLSPNGHVEQVLHGVDDGETFWAFTEPGHVDDLAAWLDRMRFMRRVEVTARPDLRVVWLARCALDAAGVLPEGAVVRDSDIPAGDQPAVEVVVPASSDWPHLPLAGTWAFDALRIAAGVPRVFVDTDQRTIPNEIGLLGTHLDKGCYRGQETVARVHNLGRPPRRLVQLHLDGSGHELPGPGTELELDGRVVGFLGQAEMHHELGPVGLGLVKRNVPVEATLNAGGVAAAQEVLVDPEVGLHVRPNLGRR